VRRPRRPSAALGRFVVVAITAIGGLALASSSVALSAALTHSEHVHVHPSQALSSTSAVSGAAMVAASQDLADVLQSDYPRSFGGVSIRVDRRIAVYMTRMPRGLAAVVHSIAPAQLIIYRHSAHSLGTLLAIHERLARDWLGLQAEGVYVVGFKPDVASSTEQVQVINPSSAQIDKIDELFAPNTISVKSVGVAPIPASYTQRVETAGQGGFPWGAVPVVVGLEACLLALVAYVLVRTRRTPPTPAPA
jgi:hypothetical protein